MDSKLEFKKQRLKKKKYLNKFKTNDCTIALWNYYYFFEKQKSISKNFIKSCNWKIKKNCLKNNWKNFGKQRLEDEEK